MSRQIRHVLSAVGLLFLTSVAYLPAMSAGFIWDDNNYVTENQTLRTTAGLWRIWTDPKATPQYYPLVHSTFWLEYQTWGLNPTGYHVVNILIHAVNAVLLWLVLKKLEIRAAWFAASLFALHPVHVESVAWITERKNVLSGLFYLASALAYISFLRHEVSKSNLNVTDRSTSVLFKSRRSPWKWCFYGLSLILFVAALLSKTVTVTLPAALFIVICWRHRRIAAGDLVPLLPMFAIGIPFGLLTIWLERNHVGAVGTDWQFSLTDRCLIAGRALWFYAMKLAWPSQLIFIYPRWKIDAAVWWQYLFPFTFIAGIGVIAWRRRNPGLLVAILFFAGSLFPALGFFNIFPMRYSFVADHFQYLASIGLIVAFACGCEQLSIPLGRMAKALPVVISAGLLLALGYATWNQAAIYADAETIWQDTIQKNPTCSMAHHNLGVVLQQQGRVSEAELEFRQVLKIDPNDNPAKLNLANVFSEQGRLAEKALALYEQILASDPNDLSARFNLANTLDRLNRSDEAAAQYRELLAIDHGHKLARLNLAALLMEQDKWDAAREQLLELLKIAPDLHSAHLNLAVVYHHDRNRERAIFHVNEGMRLAPGSDEARKIMQHIMSEQDQSKPQSNERVPAKETP